MKSETGVEIEVVAALILRDGRLLVCQRREDGAFPLQWEFPGGKLEKGESYGDALRRELMEELGIEVREFRQVYQDEHVYSGEFKVRLRFFRVVKFDGDPVNRVFRQIRWVKPSELAAMEFLDGDRRLVTELAGPAGGGLLA